MRITLAGLVLTFLSACTTHEVLLIQSPLTEFTLYVEEFNDYVRREFPRRTITALHTRNESPYGTPGNEKVDIIISPFLAAEERVSQFANLSRLLPSSFFSRPFYEDLLKKGKFRNRQYFLPLSFDLPLLLSRIEVEPSVPPYWINFSELYRDTVRFTDQTANEKLSRTGILSVDDILIPTLYHLGLSFHRDSQQFIVWDAQALDGALDIFQEWVRQLGGMDRLLAFEQTHELDPISTLLAEKKVRFAYLRASEFFSFPQNLQRTLMFRWYMHEENIHVLEGETYVGLLRSSRNSRAAKIFLDWLFTESSQKELLAIRTNSFGIARGFSSLRSVSELQLPRIHPSLIGAVPLESQLFFASALPAHWEEYQKMVVQPWLRQRLLNQEEASLREKTDQWRAQIIAY